MKTLLSYGAGVFAFAAATWAFSADATWPGVLAALAGILAIVSTFAKERAR